MLFLSIQSVVADQRMKSHVPNFIHFMIIPEHPLCKQLTGKFPTILDSFKTQS